jgi:hypothetical protein
MLVPARRERDGNPTGCTGATMEDGTIYHSTRDGHMEVSRPDHVAAMLRNSDGFITEEKFSAPRAAGTWCSACGFSGFTFHLTAPCPRCGGEMVREESTESTDQGANSDLPAQVL